jgi:hypothetical protein
MNPTGNHSKINALMASLVFGISFIVYYLTMSPSVCLWDCGEYLASSADLGIPHPPGTPMLVLIGRAWLVLFSFIKDIGFRYNFCAVVTSAITVVFIYLIIIRGLRMVLGEPDTLWKRLSFYCAGFVGSLFCAFSTTFWFESLEASEQANITNLPVAISIWLALVWAQSKAQNRDRLLLFIAYIAFLGVGIHMISMITMPAIFLFVMLQDKEKRKDWRLWITCMLLGLVMYNLSWFLHIAPIAAGVSLIMLWVSKKYRRNWRFCFWFLFLALLGFSNHIYLPIRAALHPMIDEGHPVILRTAEFPYFDASPLFEVLDRKQYGSESMVSRSMWRRGSFEHQFGIDGHMGYGGFHITQFFRLGDNQPGDKHPNWAMRDAEKNFVDGSLLGWGKLIIYLLPTFFALLGWYLMGKKNRNVAIFFIAITLLTTLCMVWYMNFSDGTRCDNRLEYHRWEQSGEQGPMPTIYREVRVRDYFFSAGFMFFSMWMGLSCGLVLYRLFSDKNRTVGTLLAPLALVLFFVSPALPLSQNYHLRDRSKNWLPFEYAYNLLMSCAPNSVLFTNGDNDTFPVWAVQEAYGIRPDVRLVNLSLVNTDWYIKQLKNVEPKVPITYSDREIEEMQPEYNPFENKTPVKLPNSGLRIVLPGRAEQQVLRVQDKMVLNIADATNFSKPVYFACSVSPDNFMGLGPYLQMQGMVYRMMPQQMPEKDQIDVAKMAYCLDSVYKLRSMPNEVTQRDEPYAGISNDYSICFLWLGYNLQERLSALEGEINAAEGSDTAVASGRKAAPQRDTTGLGEKRLAFKTYFDEAIRELDRCVSLMPWSMQPIMLRQQILLKFHQPKMAEERLRPLLGVNPKEMQIRELLGQALEAQGKRAEAESLYQSFAPQSGS